MTIQLAAQIIEFKASEDEWVAETTYKNEYIGITIPAKAFKGYGENEAKGWEIVQWSLAPIFDRLPELTAKSSRILFALQQEIFRSDYLKEQCRFDLYAIVIKSVQTINIDQPYVNFELEFSHTCDAPTFIDDIYYDYSCGYNISSGDRITLNFARRLGSCDDFDNV